VSIAAARKVGIVGLGRIGGSLARLALAKGIAVAGFNRSGASADLKQAGLEPVTSIEGFRRAVDAPRIVFVYVPAGKAVDEVIGKLEGALGPGDIIADGGNSYWRDSRVRAERLRARGIHFLDIGTSGGVPGARTGACFMVGGPPEAVAQVEPVLRALAVTGGYVHAGGPGAGHFTKLVHNGIEFGMLQAIGEGVDLLEHFDERLPVADVLKCWRNGSVIRSWLMDLLEERYCVDGFAAAPVVEDTGEVNWLVDDALRLEVPVPVIAQAVMQLIASRDEQRHWARAIAMMRHGFGEHPYGRNASIAQERREGRILGTEASGKKPP
jgi:6-phosphogluconate dehydrogenase